MGELLRNAWLGWMDYNENGKLAQLLLAVLLFFWFWKKGMEQRALVLYTTIATLCCIFPPTAAALMLYQTRFYDYQWIWSMVPMTAVVSWGIVVFIREICTGPAGKLRGLAGGVFLLAVIALCGGLGSSVWDRDGERLERKQAQRVLELVRQSCAEEGLCLWAPREIMAYVREADGAVRLPYGRDMWDPSLRAYAYDVYGEKAAAMYQWMEAASAGEEAEDIGQEVCTGYALEAGVNCILLSENADGETVEGLEKALGKDAQKLEGYWIFYGWTD